MMTRSLKHLLIHIKCTLCKIVQCISFNTISSVNFVFICKCNFVLFFMYKGTFKGLLIMSSKPQESKMDTLTEIFLSFKRQKEGLKETQVSRSDILVCTISDQVPYKIYILFFFQNQSVDTNFQKHVILFGNFVNPYTQHGYNKTTVLT